MTTGLSAGHRNAVRDWRKITIVRIEANGFADTRGFDEAVELLAFSFEAIGSSVSVTTNEYADDGVNIIVGANVLDLMKPQDRLTPPTNSIIWNLEQVSRDSPWMSEHYISLLRAFPVWDYSARNVEVLKADFGIGHVGLLRIGHLDRMRRLAHVSQDIDVLFYGRLSPRRERLIARLQRTALKTKVLTDCYGPARDAVIARSKVVLNAHFYEFPAVAEIVRLSYLLSNGKAVVSETDDDTAIEPDVRSCILPASYPDLVEACIGLVRDDVRRQTLEQTAMRIFSERSQIAFLRSAIEQSGGDHQSLPRGVGP